MLVVRMRCLKVVLQELLHLAGHVCVLLAEVVVDLNELPVHEADVLVLLVDLLRESSHLITQSLLHDLLALEDLTHPLPLLLALDLLIEDLQLRQDDRLDILEALQEALLGLLLPLRAKTNVVLYLCYLKLQALHFLLRPLDLGDVVLLERLQRARQLRDLLHHLGDRLLRVLLALLHLRLGSCRLHFLL